MKKIIAVVGACFISLLAMGQAIKKEIQTTPWIDGLLSVSSQAEAQAYIGASGSGGTNSPPPVRVDFALNAPVTNTATASRQYFLAYTAIGAGVAGNAQLSIYGNDTGAAAVTNFFPLKQSSVLTSLAATNTYYVAFWIGPGGRWYPTNESAGAGDSVSLIAGSMGYQQIVSGTNGLQGATGATGPAMSTNETQFLGVPLSIVTAALVTNLTQYGLQTNYGTTLRFPNSPTLVGAITLSGNIIISSGGSGTLLTSAPNTNSSATTYFTGLAGSGDFITVDANGQMRKTNAPAGAAGVNMTNGIVAGGFNAQLGIFTNATYSPSGNILFGTNQVSLLTLVANTNLGLASTFPFSTFVHIEGTNSGAFTLSISNSIPIGGSNIVANSRFILSIYRPQTGLAEWRIDRTSDTFPTLFTNLVGNVTQARVGTNATGAVYLENTWNTNVANLAVNTATFNSLTISNQTYYLTNGFGIQDNQVASNTYVMSFAKPANTIIATNNVMIVGPTGVTSAGLIQSVQLRIKNQSAVARTVTFTNTFKALGVVGNVQTNTIPASGNAFYLITDDGGVDFFVNGQTTQ